MRKLLGFVVALLVLLGSGVWARAESDEAYVTLLYGDEFVLGVRVLGKSIRDTGTTKDMVVLVTDGVSDYAQRLLKADGWILEHIKLLANPNHVRPKRFWGVYTKLKIFSLTKYRKVVYLDADTIVVKSIEDLFKCGRFCANLKHSERMNSGVMVVEPSETVFKDMMTKVNSLPSYTGGDQGFLNSYYADFASAHIFEPNISMQEINTKPEPELQRLSTLYNADVGLYMLANKWMVDEKELRVIHYTLGPLKPWDWWTAWLIKPVEVWQNIRERLEETLPGTGGGRNPHDLLVIKLLFILPFCMLFLCYYQSCLQINMDLFSVSCQSPLCGFVRHAYYKYKSGGGIPVYSSVGVASSYIASTSQQFPNGIHFKLPAYLGAFSVLICFISVAISLALAFVIIPQQVMPLSGLLLMYEWTFVTFFLIFGRYLHLVYLWGNANQVNYGNPDPSDDHGGKGHQRSASNCNYGTWFYWMGMAFLALTAPLLPTLLGITALFARLGLMVAGGLVLASYMTYASDHLAIRAFVEGLKAHELPRTRKICLLC